MSESTMFDLIVERYLQHWRALGRVYDSEEWILRSLSRFLNEQGFHDLDRDGFERWCKSLSRLNSVTRRYRQLIVRKLCQFRQRTEPECFVPESYCLARRSSHAPPVIITDIDVSRILTVCKQLVPSPISPLRPAVARLAIILLYTAGLRRRELVHLVLADVDADEGILHIRDSKFHKSRWVPLSADASCEMRLYLKQRLRQEFDCSQNSPLLCHCRGGFRGYTGGGISDLFEELRCCADLRGVDGRIPRVLDFRHSFAIGALLRWYRQGADVQVNLPKLAMYMGHVSIASTAYYLQWTPALAEVASQRFENHFGYLIEGERS